MPSLKGLSCYVGERLKELPPGKIVKGSSIGDPKREIDKLANDLVLSYLYEQKNTRIAVRTEFTGKWLLVKDGKAKMIETQDIIDSDVAIIVDELEGTKNLLNKDRLTTFFSFYPENLTFSQVLEAEIYRWSGETYYFKRDAGVFLNEKDVREIKPLDKIDQLTKIHGCFVASYLWMWGIIGEIIIEKFGLVEKDMPTFAGNGTTTDNLLSVMFDNSIAIDPRALVDCNRKPYVHDIIPAGIMLDYLGGKIVDFDKKKIQIDFLDNKASIPFCAVPPGKTGDRIIELLLKMKEKILEYQR